MKKSTEKKLEIENNFFKFEAKSLKFAKLLRQLKQFIWTVKNGTIFKKIILFQLVTGSKLDSYLLVSL